MKESTMLVLCCSEYVCLRIRRFMMVWGDFQVERPRGAFCAPDTQALHACTDSQWQALLHWLCLAGPRYRRA